MELIGQYEGSGFKEPPWLVRRSDGQTIQLPRLLYLLVEKADGHRSYEELAETVTAEFEKQVTADNVRLLVEERLRPLGVLAAADGSSPRLEKPDPLLALKFRVALVNPKAVRATTAIFKPLFFSPVVLGVLGGLVAVDIWVFGVHGIAQSARESIYQPALLLLVFGLIIVSAAFHEFGHAVGCRYSGATPGAMGAGIYLAWPAFYTDVTDAYRLGRGGRLRTDLGGIYFNVVVILACAAVYFATSFEPLLVVIAIQHFEIVHQLLPFIRLDGYYIVSDLTGVPDLFSRLRPILASLVPFRKPDNQVTELKWWARAVATVWVLLVIPLLLFNLVVLAVSAPRIAATAWDSAGQVADKMGDGILAGLAGVVQLLALALPIAGIALTFARLGRRLALATWRKTEERPLVRAGGLAVAAAGAAFLVFTWLPNGDYEPIRRGERGTIQDYTGAVIRSPSGRSGVVPLQRSRERGEVVDDGSDVNRRAPTTTPAPSSPTTAKPGPVAPNPTTRSTTSHTTSTTRPSTATSRVATTTTTAG